MKKIIARIVLVAYGFSLFSPISTNAAGISVSLHAGDVSSNGSTWSASTTSLKPGEYLRLSSKGNNVTAGTLSNVQMVFSANDMNFTYMGVTASTPGRFYTTAAGYSAGTTGGFNPPTVTTGTFPQSVPTGTDAYAYRYGIRLNQSYSSPTFSPGVYFTSAEGSTSSTSTITFDVDVKPHVRSVSFSAGSIPNDMSASTDLTVTVRDWNGCANITPGTATVTANLSALGNNYTSTEALTFVSCNASTSTATFQKTNIVADGSAALGANAITINVKDNDGNIGGPADSIFWNVWGNVGDTNTANLTVNSSSGPIPAVDTPANPAVLGTSGISTIKWHSSKTGTYEVRVNGTNCTDGTLVSTGTISSTATNSIVTDINATSLVGGTNTVYLCAKDLVGNVGSVTATITKDITPPTVTVLSYAPSTVSNEDFSVTWSASENGTYALEVNGVELVGSNGTNVVGTFTGANIISTINNSVLVNGVNTIKVKFTDAASNGPVLSDPAPVTKDNIPPQPPQSVTLADCDYVGNGGTPCAALGNPRSGATGRDFRIDFTLPSNTGSIQEYQVYVVPFGQSLNSTWAILKRVYQNEIVGTGATVFLSDSQTTDSNGNAFVSSGALSYYALVRAFKANGLYSTVATSPSATITNDVITYPTLVSSSFVTGTGIALTYNKALTGTLSGYDSSKLSSPSSCFTVDASSGTGAASVSGSTVIFKIQNLANVAKTCNDLAITGTGLIYDAESLYNEETLTGRTVLDGQIPSPIAISSPTSNSFVYGSGAFSLVYSLPEAMTGTNLRAKFVSSTGVTVYASLSGTSSGSHTQNFTGSSIPLTDGTVYTLTVEWYDLAWNYGISSAVTNLTYDVTPPTAPTPSTPVGGTYINSTTPLLAWLAGIDNLTPAANFRYSVQLSLVSDFSSLVYSGSNISALNSTVNPAILTNTGYYWRVNAMDQAGNVSTYSSNANFILDTVNPTVSSLASDTYVNNVTRSFTGFVKNGDSIQLIAKITDNFQSVLTTTGVAANLTGFGWGAAVNPVSYNTVSGQAIWNLTASCTDGTKNVAITATDRAGNVGTYTVTAVCDNSAPALTAAHITAPAASAYLSGGISTNITWNTSFYSTELSPIALPIDVDYSTDGITYTPIATSVANVGSVSWTVPALDSNTVRVRLTAKDKLGNTVSAQNTFTVDSTAPSVLSDAIVSPNGGEFLKGSTGTGIVITWTPAKVTDMNIAANPVTLEYSLNSGGSWNAIASSLPNSGSYTWSSVPALNNANVRIRLTAADRVGKTANDVSDADFTIDSTLPTVTVTSPSTPPNNSYISAPGFDIHVAGADTNLDRVSYTFANGGMYWMAGTSNWIGSANWNDLCVGSASCNDVQTLLTPPITDGTSYQLVFRSIDKAGNLQNSSTYNYTADTVNPNVATAVSSGSYYSGSVNIAGTSSDARSGVSAVKVSLQRITDSLYWNGTAMSGTSSILLATTTANGYANWSYSGFSVPAGDADGTQYSLYYQATDNAYKTNNVGSGTVTITKDASGPSIAGGAWTYPTAGAFWNGSSNVSLTWNSGAITDPYSGVAQSNGVVIEYLRASTGSWQMLANRVANSGSYAYTVPMIDDDVTFRIRAYDNAGNLGAGVTSPTVTIDSLPPTVSSVQTMDQAASGKIDGVLVTMSEPIKCSTVTPSDFSFSLGIGAPTSVSSCVGNSQTFILNFAPTGDTSSKPTLSYTKWTLTDRAGNFLATVSGVASTDGAVPRLLSAKILDSNSNGKVDRIQAYFSETMAASANTSAWTVNNPLIGVGATPTTVSVSGTSAILTLSEPTAYDTSTGGMTISFTSNASWKDVSAGANQAASISNVTLADQALPAVVSSVTRDNGGTYAARITLSEPITDTTYAGFAISGASSYTGAKAAVTPTSFDILTGDSTATDTSKTFTLTYAGTLQDASGNMLATIVSRGVSDAIVPKILSRRTADLNANGKVDAIVYTLSESTNSNFTGLSASVVGYPTVSYSASGNTFTVNVTEKSTNDTDATPDAQVTNTSLADTAGNILASEVSASTVSDGVGPVVVAARYNGSSIHLDLSESFSGSLIPSNFVLSGSSVSVTSVSATSGTPDVDLTVSGSVVYGTTEVSLATNVVGDGLGNKQTALLFSKVSATVVISEVMWSGSGSSKSQYVELQNLGSTPIDISGWKIDNAASNGTATLTLPASQTIAANGYYLITSTSPSLAWNLLNDSIVPDLVTASLSLSPAQTNSLVLKNASNAIYDRALAPWPFGNDVNVVSMERSASPGDGLQSSRWYSAKYPGLFESASARGTPGQANVSDANAPTVTLGAPTDSSIIPVGTGVTVSYTYTDDILMTNNPTRTFLLEKNNGSGSFVDVTATYVSSSTGSSSAAAYTLSGLVSGAYRTTFTVQDAAGNPAQKIGFFYIDNPQLSVSNASLSIGTLPANTLVTSTGTLVITVKTVGTPFNLNLGGTGTLDAGYDQIPFWNGGDGFAFVCTPTGSATAANCTASLAAPNNALLQNVASPSPDPNGNLKTFTYTVSYSAKVNDTRSAGNYSVSQPVRISLTY